jgi:hypothetical protein
MVTTDPPPADAATDASPCADTGASASRRMPSHLHSPFGTDRFGKGAERFARFFGTPKFILGQTVLVAVWITRNAVAFGEHWDPYPFILLIGPPAPQLGDDDPSLPPSRSAASA